MGKLGLPMPRLYSEGGLFTGSVERAEKQEDARLGRTEVACNLKRAGCLDILCLVAWGGRPI